MLHVYELIDEEIEAELPPAAAPSQVAALHDKQAAAELPFMAEPPMLENDAEPPIFTDPRNVAEPWSKAELNIVPDK